MPCRRWKVCSEIVGSGSHCRMLSMVGAATTVWLALMVVLAGNCCTCTLFRL